MRKLPRNLFVRYTLRISCTRKSLIFFTRWQSFGLFSISSCNACTMNFFEEITLPTVSAPNYHRFRFEIDFSVVAHFRNSLKNYIFFVRHAPITISPFDYEKKIRRCVKMPKGESFLAGNAYMRVTFFSRSRAQPHNNECDFSNVDFFFRSAVHTVSRTVRFDFDQHIFW